MVTNFENETHELTDQELNMVSTVKKILELHVGKNNPVISDKIMEDALHMYQINLGTGARVRKLINYIRVTGLIPNLAASSRGYWIETDLNELRKYVRSLRERASAIRTVADRVQAHIEEKVLENAGKQQTKLF